MPSMSLPTLRPFSRVRVTRIRADRFAGSVDHFKRPPQVGDVGYIVDTFETPEIAYEVECSDIASGETIWMCAMYPDEVVFAET